jgi:phosphoketolase
LHVRGYDEKGTTTTPFDMFVRNHVSRLDRFDKPEIRVWEWRGA